MLQRDRKGVRSVLDRGARAIEAGVEDVVGHQAHDREQQAGGGRNQRFRHATRDHPGRGGDVAGAEGAERAHHAGDRAEETEQRRRGDAGVERRQTRTETLELAAGREGVGIIERALLVRQGVGVDAGHGVLAATADGDGPGNVPLLDLLEHLRGDRRVGKRLFTHEEDHALDDDGEEQEGNRQDGPHHEASVLKQLHGSLVHQKCQRGNCSAHVMVDRFCWAGRLAPSLF